MPNLPAFCSQCGLIFGSGIFIDNSTNIQLNNVLSSCPRCGALARVPDGIYNVLGGAVELLSGPKRSVEQLQLLKNVFEKAREQGKSREQVQTEIVQAVPELSSLATALPTTRGELYAFITTILTLLTLMVSAYAAWKPAGPSQEEINSMVSQALQKNMQTSNAKGTTTTPKRNNLKTGRNEKCPCGSGKKFKKCCLLPPADG